MTNGLDNVVAAETCLSDVDGDAGQLVIRGYLLDQLAGKWRFEEVTHLLLGGFFTNLPAELVVPLGNARSRVFALIAPRVADLAQLPVYDAMRALTALVEDGDDLETALALIAAPAVATSAVLRHRMGKAAIAPDPRQNHADDVVRMIGIETDGAALARALDAYLVTVIDHGFNASTFAARVVSSTQAGLTSAVMAGLSALKGPLHGGAPGPVLAMLDQLAKSSDPRGWLEGAVHDGERLMGFGHRIYRVRDPRADALKAALRKLDTRLGRLDFAENMEALALDVLRKAKPGRVLETNVEFYTALLLEAVGFPADSFTCVFAMGRAAGWIAHAREQRLTGRLIRPQSLYVGPAFDLAA